MASVGKFSCVVAVADNGGIGKNNQLPWHLKGDLQYFSHLTSTVSTEGVIFSRWYGVVFEQELRDPGKENAVIMGRNTWQSIPEKYRPLRHRLNIVLSRKLSEAPEGAMLFSSLQDALDKLSRPPYSDKVEKIFVIGGAAVYKKISFMDEAIETSVEAMEHPGCYRLYITHVYKDYECDVHFPTFDKNVFKETSVAGITSEMKEENGIKYKFQVYQRDMS